MNAKRQLFEVLDQISGTTWRRHSVTNSWQQDYKIEGPIGHSRAMQCDFIIKWLLFFKRHPIARPSWRGMGCLVLVRSLFYILPWSLQWCMQYRVILDRIISALDCNAEFATTSSSVISQHASKLVSTCWLISVNKIIQDFCRSRFAVEWKSSLLDISWSALNAFFYSTQSWQL